MPLQQNVAGEEMMILPKRQTVRGKFLGGIVGRILVGGTLILMAQAGAVAQTSGEPVKLGVSLGLTSSFGQQLMRGLELGVEETNAKGGVLGGRPIKLVSYDDQDKPEQTSAIFERLITRDKVVLVIGPLLTPTTAVSLNISKRYGKVQIAPGAKTGKLRDDGHDRAFFLNTTLENDGSTFDNYVATRLKPKTVALLTESTEYGAAAIRLIEKDWAGAGSPQVIAKETLIPSDTDFSPVLTKLKGLNPDAIYIVIGNLETSAAVLRQMNELGIKSTRLMSAGSVSGGLIKLAGKVSDGLVFGDFYSNQKRDPTNTAFVEAFEKKFKYAPDKLELTGYESILVAAKAIDKAGSIDDGAVADAMRSDTYQTPRGTWKFVKLGHSWQAPADAVILTIKNGGIVPYGP
jgi:branched-chain amino acid transport system substrate-binding protein